MRLATRECSGADARKIRFDAPRPSGLLRAGSSLRLKNDAFQNDAGVMAPSGAEWFTLTFLLQPSPSYPDL
jgi:hypothetical protein